jgi:hypothetical protein
MKDDFEVVYIMDDLHPYLALFGINWDICPEDVV